MTFLRRLRWWPRLSWHRTWGRAHLTAAERDTFLSHKNK